MHKENCVLFLGAGATAGSGIKRSNETLPADSKFFKKLDGKLQEKYPALYLFRENYWKNDSLYQTWNDLYVFRGLADAGIIRAKQEVVDQFLKLSKFEGGDNKQHYSNQFRIIKPSRHKEYYLAELAIWDLRVLVKDIYTLNRNDDLGGCVYKDFWGELNDQYNVSAVVNLNYDTTFDDCCLSEVEKSKILRPHGSLKWTSKSKYSVAPRGWFGGWSDFYDDTEINELGYIENKSDRNILDFTQPLIVPTAMFKEEVVGTSSTPGIQSPILLEHWQRLELALRESANWLFVGTSFSSGDEHLLLLLKALYNKDHKKICCSVYCDQLEPVDVLWNRLSTGAICVHRIGHEETIDKFFNNVCYLRAT